MPVTGPNGLFQQLVLSWPAAAWPRISPSSRGLGLPSCGLCRDAPVDAQSVLTALLASEERFDSVHGTDACPMIVTKSVTISGRCKRRLSRLDPRRMGLAERSGGAHACSPKRWGAADGGRQAPREEGVAEGRHRSPARLGPLDGLVGAFGTWRRLPGSERIHPDPAALRISGSRHNFRADLLHRRRGGRPAPSPEPSRLVVLCWRIGGRHRGVRRVQRLRDTHPLRIAAPGSRGRLGRPLDLVAAPERRGVHPPAVSRRPTALAALAALGLAGRHRPSDHGGRDRAATGASGGVRRCPQPLRS
jgi:hypothetical protein